jgi:truncated hemoglobin YjbI
MKRITSLLCFTLMTFAAVVPAYTAPPQAAAETQQKSLYQRLGGYDALAAVTDDFIAHLATDPQLGRFFTGLSTDSKIKVRQHVVDFLCLATGGPASTPGGT